MNSWPDEPPLIPTSKPVCIERWHSGHGVAGQDRVAIERPVALVYNGVSHAVMLATPADLEDFALGFSLTEGIIGHPNEIFDIDSCEQSQGVVVNITISSRRFELLKERRRSLAGRTGCGLCGVDSLEQVCRPLAKVSASQSMSPQLLQSALAELGRLQLLQQATGAVHAAAWVTSTGTIDLIREDVGRHNALDKLIGALVRKGTDFRQGALIITSRASFEMVQKAVSVGAGILAALSAPTALAIECAMDWNLTLIGFLRPGTHTAYSHAWRLIEPQIRTGTNDG